MNQRRKEVRHRDPELMKMVENYLILNSNKTYVDIDEMVASLQSRSYRFSRMKKQIFSNLVKDAYYVYCNQNNGYCDEDQDPAFLAVPPKTASPVKRIPVADIHTITSDISDSDIEIEESPKGAMNVQITGLYQSNSKPGPSTPNSQILQKNTRKSVLSNQSKESSSSSTASGTSFLDIVPVPLASAEINKSSRAKEGMDKSEDELEIIDEVSGSPKILKKINTSVPNDLVVTQISTLKPIVKTLGPGRKEENRSLKIYEIIKDLDVSISGCQTNKKVQKRKVTALENDSTSKIIPESKRSKKDMVPVHESTLTFADFGGSEKVIEEICKLLMHLKHPEIYQTLGVTPPRGFLLHGPPGCGKTLLANAISGELKLPMLKMAATELVSGISGESENNIRELFDQALNLAPCVIFIDEIDSITPKRETAQREMEKRIVAQLLACIDDLSNKEKGHLVLLIGATNRIESIDVALRRAGRFDREICLGIPDEKARDKIIQVLSRKLRLSVDFNISSLAKLTPGYVGADLQALLREAAVESVNNILTATQMSETTIELNTKCVTEEIMDVDISKIGNEAFQDDTVVTQLVGEVGELPEPKTASPQPMIEPANAEQVNSKKDSEDVDKSPTRWFRDITPLNQSELNKLFIKMSDFEKALKRVQPSSKREGFATVPDTTWDDIGALKEIRDELEVSILGPVKYNSAFQALGLDTPAGVMLCGPPGCGKTLLAKAVANEAGVNFISVKGPELLNMYVGESERAVRQCFLRAKNSSPCVIFFDELDALCPRRSDGPETGSTSRVVNQLLTEMDGMESRLGVFVMAATNRPDIIDPAILRPGRLDKILFVNLPTPDDRVDILRAITKSGSRPILGEDVNMESIGRCEKCIGYTGADLAALVREASIASFRELVLEAGARQEKVKDEDLKVYQRHFETAFMRTKPSVSKKDQEKYEQMKERYSSLS